MIYYCKFSFLAKLNREDKSLKNINWFTVTAEEIRCVFDDI